MASDGWVTIRVRQSVRDRLERMLQRKRDDYVAGPRRGNQWHEAPTVAWLIGHLLDQVEAKMARSPAPRKGKGKGKAAKAADTRRRVSGEASDV